jgi:hypothetical protein
MRHRNIIKIPFKSAYQAIYITICSMCLLSNFLNICFNPCWRPATLRIIVQSWSCLAKFPDEVWNCVLSGPTSMPNFTWNALLTFSGLSDYRIYSSMMWYPPLGTVQNRTKTNDKQMVWVLQCVSIVSSNYNHSLRRKLSLNLVSTFGTTLYETASGEVVDFRIER